MPSPQQDRHVFDAFRDAIKAYIQEGVPSLPPWRTVVNGYASRERTKSAVCMHITK
jgi:hypothetical protein